MKDARTLPLSHFRSIHIMTLCYMKNTIVQFVRHKNLKTPRFVATIIIFIYIYIFIVVERRLMNGHLERFSLLG